MRVQAGAVLVISVSLLACNSSRPVSAATETASSGVAAQTTPAAPLHVDGNRVLQYTKEIVAFGPRFLGSSGHQRALDYLKQHLTRDAAETDSFTAQTPAGALPVTNVIAKFPGTKDGIVVVVSHYDTNYPLRNSKYVGANDGACTSALLLEIANQLRGKKRDGNSVWLVWSDGEEAVKDWTPQDSVYGTRHLAQKWQQDGTAKKIKGLLVADMICDAELDVARDTNSTAWLVDLVQQAASDLGYQSHFFQTQLGTDDDHTPFLKIGIPSADIIDFNYGYNNAFWHTPEDTVDKLSPRSAQIAGDVILRTIQLLDSR